MTDRDSDAVQFFAKKTFHHSVSVKVFWFSTMPAIMNCMRMNNRADIGCHTNASSNHNLVYSYRHLLHSIGTSIEIGTFVVNMLFCLFKHPLTIEYVTV